MSQIAIDLAVVPVLVALTLFLEGTRLVCTWVVRQVRAARTGLEQVSQPVNSH